MSIVLREGLGRPLTYAELDENFRTVAQVGDTASVAATAAADAAAQAVQSAQSAAASAAAAGGKVSLTGNETVAGVKTFTSSPLVPTPPVSDSSTRAQTTAGSLAQIAAGRNATGSLQVVMPSGVVGDPNFSAANMGGLPGNMVSLGFSYSTGVLGPAFIGARSYGAIGAHGAVASGRSCLALLGEASDGAAFQVIGRIDLNTEAAATSTSSPGEIVLSTTPIGSVAPTAAVRVRANSEVQCLGSLTAALPVRVGQYTLTTLPSAATYSGYEIDVTNATGGSKRCRSNGTVWQILNTTTTVS